MSYQPLDPSYKGFLKEISSGKIFPVFEKETIKNVEIDNISLKRKGLSHQIRFEVVSKEDYDAYMGVSSIKEVQPIKEVKKVQQPVKTVRKTGRKPVKK